MKKGAPSNIDSHLVQDLITTHINFNLLLAFMDSLGLKLLRKVSLVRLTIKRKVIILELGIAEDKISSAKMFSIHHQALRNKPSVLNHFN